MTARWKTAYLALGAGLLLFAGCKDLFHPEGPAKAETPVQYTVSYNANGATGTPPAAQTVNAGDSVTIAGQGGLSKTSHVFSGWSTGADGEGTVHSAGDSYTPTGSITLYAKWTVQYTVSYDANGADGTPPAAQTVNAGSSLTLAGQQGMSYAGYTFIGWDTNAGGGMGELSSAGDLYTPIASLTLYAQWTLGAPTQYTVTFNADGGIPETQTKTVDSGASVGSTNMPSVPAKTDYVFGGWYTEQNGGGTLFTATTTVNGNINVYAKWTIIQYTVTFDADGGSPTGHQETVNSGGSVGVGNMPSEPIRTLYAFGGWYTGQNGGGTLFTETTTVSGDIIVYAKWTVQYTVSYDANGANGTPPTTQTVNSGSSVTVAGSGGLTYAGYSFSGWNTSVDDTGTPYNAGDSYTPTVSITLYAQWTSIVPDLPLSDALTWVSNNAVEGGSYPITVKSNETIPSRTLSYGGKTVTVILEGDTTERIVSPATNGILFAIGNGVTLTLDNNIALQAGCVSVDSGGTLVMNTGSKISGNTSSYGGGGGVNVNGSFIMNDGSISDNFSGDSGGGVCVWANGSFIMHGGTISGNTSSSSYGGGGGVYIIGNGTLTGGTISGNTATYGGGVYVSGGTFIMSGGTISGNIASYGGGVYSGGTFTMSGGTISGHTVSRGGGVYVGNGTFIKQQVGGTIYGSNESDISLKNTASSGDSYGHAVYVNSPPAKRNTTAGVGVTLDSSKSISDGGGWE